MNRGLFGFPAITAPFARELRPRFETYEGDAHRATFVPPLGAMLLIGPTGAENVRLVTPGTVAVQRMAIEARGGIYVRGNGLLYLVQASDGHLIAVDRKSGAVLHNVALNLRGMLAYNSVARVVAGPGNATALVHGVSIDTHAEIGTGLDALDGGSADFFPRELPGTPYVFCNGGGHLNLIDVSDMSSAGRLLSSRVGGVAYAPRTRRALVGSATDDVAIVDPLAVSIDSTIDLADDSTAVVRPLIYVQGTDTVWAFEDEDDPPSRVAIIDAATGTIQASVELPVTMGGAAFCPVDQAVYMVAKDAPRAYTIDVRTLQITRIIELS